MWFTRSPKCLKINQDGYNLDLEHNKLYLITLRSTEPLRFVSIVKLVQTNENRQLSLEIRILRQFIIRSEDAVKFQKILRTKRLDAKDVSENL